MLALHKDYLQQAKGQHGKIILFSMVMFVVAMVLTFMISMITMLIFGGVVSAVFAGGEPTPGKIFLAIVLYIILLFVLGIISILIITPLITGLYHWMIKAGRGEQITFKDGFIAFKDKDHFIKLIKLGLFNFAWSNILIMALVALFFLTAMIFIVLGATLLPSSNDVGAISVFGIFLFILFYIIAYILYIIVICLVSLVVFMTQAIYLENYNMPTIEKVKTAFKTTFKGKVGIWSLLIQNILFIIAYSIVTVVLYIAMIFLFAQDNVFTSLLAFIILILLFLMFCLFSYFIMGSLVSFYHHNKHVQPISRHSNNEHQDAEKIYKDDYHSIDRFDG